MSTLLLPHQRAIDLPAPAAGSSGPATPALVEIAAGPVAGATALAAVIGVSTTLQALYATERAEDDASRVALLAFPSLPDRLRRQVAGSGCSAFDADVLALHPFWLVSAVVIVEHELIRATDPCPEDLGGYRLQSVLPGAIHLASIASPFDAVVVQLRRLTEGAGRHGR